MNNLSIVNKNKSLNVSLIVKLENGCMDGLVLDSLILCKSFLCNEKNKTESLIRRRNNYFQTIDSLQDRIRYVSLLLKLVNFYDTVILLLVL